MPIITGKQKKLRYLPVAKADTPFKALDDSFVKFSLVLSLFCSVTVCLFWINLTHTHTHTKTVFAAGCLRNVYWTPGLRQQTKKRRTSGTLIWFLS